MKILIAGAGIGGTAAALCLLQAGHEVQCFEQTGAFGEPGAGLQCGANALRVLDHLGLKSALSELAVQPERIEFRDYQSGATLHQIALGQDYASRFGQPYFHLHRADLHRVQIDTLQARAPNALLHNAVVDHYVEAEQGVHLTLSDGREFSGDALIGADGIRSTVRRQLLGDGGARFTGNVAWRVVVPTERLPDDWMAPICSNFVGPRKHAVLYYLRNRRLANLVGVVENSSWTDDAWQSVAPWSELQVDFAGWHPTVQAVINAADKDQCYRWALYDHQPLSNWSSARVTLLGDAAHATLPFMAAGAALALEDALVLSRAFDQSSSLGEGMQLYQRNRLPRTTRVQTNSALMGRLYHIENRTLRRTAFAGLRFAGGREAFLPEYDASTVPLT